MNVMIFGATGMVGQGVLRECLQAPDVQAVLVVGRTAIGMQAPRLTELLLPDMQDYGGLDAALSGYDACFFCLGVSSAGMSEEQYSHLTHDLTLAAAETLSRLNPQMTFVYVSGAGTDSSEKGRSMWARVKGRTENDLRRLPFKAAYMFRPAGIQPLHGITSKTASYRLLYSLTRPLLPLLRWLAPGYMTTTEQVGRAMLIVARRGHASPILESRDIDALR